MSASLINCFGRCLTLEAGQGMRDALVCPIDQQVEGLWLLLNDYSDAAEWHELLTRVRVAEHAQDVLVETILRNHDDHHSSPARWCPARPCRLADRMRHSRSSWCIAR
jgi:hypothetical protein